ncbi:immunity 51 family protein [Microbispora bryophytorum]|uniref:immunity 51 family protein n=1 Tax=Microbispora bryophytorum TaxID=1460882 RepID=UPI0033E740AB
MGVVPIAKLQVKGVEEPASQTPSSTGQGRVPALEPLAEVPIDPVVASSPIDQPDGPQQASRRPSFTRAVSALIPTFALPSLSNPSSTSTCRFRTASATSHSAHRSRQTPSCGRRACLAARHRKWHHAPMHPLRLIESAPEEYSLLLDAGTTQVDDLIEELGHTPNGYYWEGVAQLLVSTEAPALEGRFSYDPEGDMFCAYGRDRGALEELGTLMAAIAADADRMRRLVAVAEADGFEFDD